MAVEIPESCPFCAAPRTGIQEGRVYFKCGTVVETFHAKPRAKRSSECVNAAKQPSK